MLNKSRAGLHFSEDMMSAAKKSIEQEKNKIMEAKKEEEYRKKNGEMKE